MLFSNGKPVIDISDALWRGIENETALAKRVNAAPRDPRRAEGYSAVLVHGWSMNLDNIQKAINLFGPRVRVITPEEFIALVRRNVAPQPPGLRPNRR